MPQISIIVPVYNVEKYIHRCLDSIIAQTFTDWECILVDDGSSDNSGKICDEYAEKDNRFKVIHKENGGQAIARNMALDIATGDYISFVDSDDCVHPQYLEILCHNATENGAQISTCSCLDFSTDIPTNIFIDSACDSWIGKDFLTHCLLDGIPKKPWVLWDKLWHRSCFENVRMPEGRIFEDNAIVYKIIYEADRVADCNSQLYFYFQNMTGTVNQPFKKKHLDWLLVPKEMMEYFHQKGDNILEDKASKIYLNELIINFNKTKKYISDRNIEKSLKKDLSKQVKIERNKYPIIIKTHPQIYEILHPVYSELYWSIKGILSKFKRSR